MARHSPARDAWLLCGTLDIVYAAAVSVMQGGTASAMLHAVASGPFGDGARGWGFGGDVAGLVTHFAIMGVMVWAFVATRDLWPAAWPWWLVGIVYGLILYLVMNAFVLPLRFGSPFPPTDLARGAIALFPHIFFVGLPLGWMFNRKDARRC